MEEIVVFFDTIPPEIFYILFSFSVSQQISLTNKSHECISIISYSHMI